MTEFSPFFMVEAETIEEADAVMKIHHKDAGAHSTVILPGGMPVEFKMVIAGTETAFTKMCKGMKLTTEADKKFLTVPMVAETANKGGSTISGSLPDETTQ